MWFFKITIAFYPSVEVNENHETYEFMKLYIEMKPTIKQDSMTPFDLYKTNL